jgi:hypothetical protein
MWRGGVNLRPCLIVGDAVVAVRVGARNILIIVIMRLEDGSEVWSTSPIDLPGWVRPALDDTTEFELAADTDGGHVVLHWTARARYRGGASPSERVLAEQSREAAGVVRLNLADRSVHSATAPPGAQAARTGASTGRERKPDVVEQAHIDDLVLELVLQQHAGADTVSLRAVDPGSEEIRWEVRLDDAIERRPRKLRP